MPLAFFCLYPRESHVSITPSIITLANAVFTFIIRDWKVLYIEEEMNKWSNWNIKRLEMSTFQSSIKEMDAEYPVAFPSELSSFEQNLNS